MALRVEIRTDNFLKNLCRGFFRKLLGFTEARGVIRTDSFIDFISPKQNVSRYA